jgi:hypothetical protein
VSFDAQCDLAAVVYGADDDPDRLISGFAADLRRSGGRPVGVVQLGRSCRAESPRLGVVMLLQRSAQGPVDLCLRIGDVQHLVSILLALSCEAKRLQPGPELEGPPSGAIPLPLSAINVGQTDDDQTFLLLEVGAASLMFGVPSATLSEVGQTLLALSARVTGKPS